MSKIEEHERKSTENQKNLRAAHPFEPNQSRGEVQDLCCGDVVGVERGLKLVFYNLKPCDRTEFWHNFFWQARALAEGPDDGPWKFASRSN